MAAVLCTAMSRLSLRAPKPFTAARSLSFKANGIAAAPRLTVVPQRAQQQQLTPAALQVVAADGPRGCKLKTRKAAAKRYKITGSGKVLVRRSGKQHLNEKMNKAKKKALGKMRQVSDSDLRKVVGCLPGKGLSKGGC